MDEGTREGQPAVETASDEDTKSPEELRREIERTRLELGDTVEALGHKTDVKGQAQERIAEVKGQAREKVESIKQRASAATPSTAKEAGTTATATAKSNPLPFAVGAALLAGFLIGRLTKGD
jgi:ElaB/YqjD/DUF883 family membrane-anchored ribosome-binding protein